MMIRLFIAIDLPPAICARLHEMARELPGARPVPENQLHLTLIFLGDIEQDRVAPLTEALATVTSPAFTLAMQGVGHFPPRGTPRVVWAGITPQPDLGQLHARIELALEQLGYAREARPFSPHITLARLKTTRPESFRQFLAKHGSFATEPFRIAGFSLYSSRLTSAGAIHKAEALFELEK